MPSTTDIELLDGFSEATKEFLFYFYEALKYLAPISDQDEDPTPSARILSTGAQELMEEILQGLRWFRNRNQLSALQLGDLDLWLANLQLSTNPTEPSVAWLQSLTIDNIRTKIGEASQVYGQEGMDMLLQLQEKIMKLHKEAVHLTEESINGKLIQQDRDETRLEDRQFLLDNIEVPVPQPSGDIVTVCLSICLAVAKTFTKNMGHKKSRQCSREIQATQLEIEADKARLKELRMQGVGIRKANAAIGNCHTALQDMKGSAFNSLEKQAKLVSEPGQPISQNILRVLRSDVGQTVMAQWYVNVQIDEFLDAMENPENGLVKSPTVIRIKEFHNKTKDISRYVDSLLSIRIIHEKHRDNFVDNIVRIAKEFAEMLDKIRNMFAVWSRYAGRDSSEAVFFNLKKEADEVTRKFPPFDREVGKCIQEVRRILEKKQDRGNSKWVQKWQKDGDRVLEGQRWAGRPLATTAEAAEVVQKLEDITNAVLKLSNEVMPPLLECNAEGNLPHGQRPRRETLKAVPESLLTMITTALFVENVNLKDFGSKGSAHV